MKYYQVFVIELKIIVLFFCETNCDFFLCLWFFFPVLVVFVNNLKMSHKCNRDDCPPAHINGPTASCPKCKNTIYLKCFGITNVSTVNNLQVAEIPLKHGATIFVPLTMSVACCCGIPTQTSLKTAIKAPPARGTSNNRTQKPDSIDQPSILSEIVAVKVAINEINDAASRTVTELTEIKSVATKSLSLIELSNEQNRNVTANKVIHTMNSQTPSFAQVLHNSQNPTRKRRLSSSMPSSNPKPLHHPEPKTGTRDTCIGPVVDMHPKKKNDHQKFNDAVWISQLHPSVSVDQINQYIIENTEINRKDLFECVKLVKKDADISKLKFVSFKINVAAEHFDYLLNPNIWPKNVTVREFMQKPTQPTLADFITDTSTETNRNKQPRHRSPNGSQPMTTGSSPKTQS